jgi:hypothetical protein
VILHQIRHFNDALAESEALAEKKQVPEKGALPVRQ